MTSHTGPILPARLERAAEIILASTEVKPGRGLTIRPADTAQALADAGLLVTDEIQAVLDAALDIRTRIATFSRLAQAVDAWVAATVPADNDRGVQA